MLVRMILATAVATAIADGPPERQAWSDCLTIYAQPQLYTNKSAATITLEALAVCRPERALYAARLRKDAPDHAAADTRLSDADADSARMLIRFINRMRSFRRG